MKKFLLFLLVTMQIVTVTKAQEKMVVERTNGSTTEFYVDEVARVYFKEDVAMNCRALPNFFVAFTDGIATDWTVESNVFLSYAMIFSKTYYDSLQDDEDAIIAEILKDNTGASFVDRVYWWTSDYGRNFWEADKEYVLCTISYNEEGKRGQLVAYPFKTLSTGLPVAELSNITIASYGNEYWKFDVTLKYGAVSYYYWGSYNEELYDVDRHYIAWLCKRYSTEDYKTSDTSWTLRKDGGCLVFVTWGVDAWGNFGDYSYASWSATSPSRKRANSDTSSDNSRGMIKFDESHLKSFMMFKME